ncbi:MAG: T9SS type A sorting domain-containing protein [Leeuwenhoekiella sp.]
MRKFYVSLFVLLGWIASAQDEALYDTQWYLNELIVAGENVVIPKNDELAGVPAEFFPIEIKDFLDINFSTSACNTLRAQFKFGDNNTFTVAHWNSGLAFCQEAANDGFDPKYFQLFGETNDSEKYYKYVIETIGTNQKILTITKFNGDSATYSTERLSIDQREKLTYRLYPNPAKELVRIEGAKNTKLQVKIYNLLGKLLLSTVTESGQISIVSIPTGVYLVNVQNGSSMSTHKLVKS